MIAIDVSEATGDCELRVVGEYYAYSKTFWIACRWLGMSISLCFFLMGFLLNFMHVGLV